MSKATPLIAMSAAPEEGGSGSILLLSPAVGVLRGIPSPGHLFGPGESIGSLTILDRAHPLLIPEGVAGLVTEVHVPGSGADALPVGYGQSLVTLAPLDAAAAGEGVREALERARAGAGATGSAGAGDTAIPEGCHGVPCPADGVFYRKPRPTDPPYVEVGSRVRNGQRLALIEAMKAFSAISYGAPGLPAEAEIVEIRAEDSTEVRHGQILFVVR